MFVGLEFGTDSPSPPSDGRLVTASHRVCAALSHARLAAAAALLLGRRRGTASHQRRRLLLQPDADCDRGGGGGRSEQPAAGRRASLPQQVGTRAGARQTPARAQPAVARAGPPPDRQRARRTVAAGRVRAPGERRTGRRLGPARLCAALRRPRPRPRAVHTALGGRDGRDGRDGRVPSPSGYRRAAAHLQRLAAGPAPIPQPGACSGPAPATRAPTQRRRGSDEALGGQRGSSALAAASRGRRHTQRRAGAGGRQLQRTLPAPSGPQHCAVDCCVCHALCCRSWRRHRCIPPS